MIGITETEKCSERHRFKPTRVTDLLKKIRAEVKNPGACCLFRVPKGFSDTRKNIEVEKEVRGRFGKPFNFDKKKLKLPNPTEWVIAKSSLVDEIRRVINERTREDLWTTTDDLFHTFHGLENRPPPVKVTEPKDLKDTSRAEAEEGLPCPKLQVAEPCAKVQTRPTSPDTTGHSRI